MFGLNAFAPELFLISYAAVNQRRVAAQCEPPPVIQSTNGERFDNQVQNRIISFHAKHSYKICPENSRRRFVRGLSFAARTKFIEFFCDQV